MSVIASATAFNKSSGTFFRVEASLRYLIKPGVECFSCTVQGFDLFPV